MTGLQASGEYYKMTGAGMNTETKKGHALWLALAVSLVITAFSINGGIYRLDRWMEDALFQRPQATSGNVVVIGIDENSLDTYGPYQSWDRNIMASALEQLASDPENMPAVVAVDTLYAGETDAPDETGRTDSADERLAKAAEQLGCVVTADAASFGSELMVSPEEMGGYNITAFEEPYPALKAVSAQGHINAMNDVDGILRHAILYLNPPEGDRVYSMAEVCAQMFCEKEGRELTLPEVNRKGQFYVSYSGLPGAFYEKTASLANLIDGTLPADYYAGKIVLIGPYAAGLQDSVYTPIARGEQMYGVEYQANVIEAFLRGEYKYESPDLWQALLLFVLLFCGLLILYRLSLVLSSVVAAGILGLDLLLCYLMYQIGFIMHPLWVPVWLFVVYVISVGIRYLLEQQERRRVTQTFERYVAPEIVQDILAAGTDALQLGGKLCDIAVLFVDVRGFTTMSERLDPETVVSILNRYLDMTSECIARNKGTLDKFVGDATMAFWGAPLPQDDSIYLGVKTAMEIVEGAKRVSKELVEEIGEELNVGVGVHYGPAVVGNIGAERRMDYTAIGDTVNTSARLEANAPGGTVYISRVVADALEGRIRATSLGDTVKLKGKADGFEVLKVEALD